MGCEGVICVETGHIEVHESGAVEAFGHKVITLPGENSKLTSSTLSAYMDTFLADETHPHMVQPGMVYISMMPENTTASPIMAPTLVPPFLTVCLMVYISMPTEFGMVYTREELTALYATCQKYDLRLFIDGARLGYGLVSEACDYDLPFLAKHCDVFYIGGTKVGAMMGEAVVFSGMKAPKYFFTNIKRHGALLAKGSFAHHGAHLGSTYSRSMASLLPTILLPISSLSSFHLPSTMLFPRKLHSKYGKERAIPKSFADL